MKRIVSQISRAMIGLAGVGIVVMLVLVTSDVLMRAAFNIAIPGIDTIVASYLMVSTIFLPLAMLQIVGENISVDVLNAVTSTRVQIIFDVLGHLITTAFYLVLAWLYTKVAINAFEIGEYVTGTWDIPIWPARIIMPLGLYLGALAAALMGVLSIIGVFTGRPVSPHPTSEPV